MCLTEARPFGCPLYSQRLRRRAAEYFESRSPAGCLWACDMEVGLSISEDLHDRAARAAMNQTMFREFNERANELNARMGFVAPVEWICECANDTCVEPIEMSTHEYEAVRQDGGCFLVAPADKHFWPHLERVIRHCDRYWIVERIGHAGDLARRHDQRSAQRPLPLRT
jgi:hypothetical protein